MTDCALFVLFMKSNQVICHRNPNQNVVYFRLDSLEELRTDKCQQVLQKFEEGRFEQNPFEGLVNGGDEPRIGIVFLLLLLFVLFLLLLFIFFFSLFLLKKKYWLNITFGAHWWALANWIGSIILKSWIIYPFTIISMSWLTPFPRPLERPFFKSSWALSLLSSCFLFNLHWWRTLAAANSVFMKCWKRSLMWAVLSASLSSHMSSCTRGCLYPFITMLERQGEVVSCMRRCVLGFFLWLLLTYLWNQLKVILLKNAAPASGFCGSKQ